MLGPLLGPARLRSWGPCPVASSISQHRAPRRRTPAPRAVRRGSAPAPGGASRCYELHGAGPTRPLLRPIPGPPRGPGRVNTPQVFVERRAGAHMLPAGLFANRRARISLGERGSGRGLSRFLVHTCLVDTPACVLRSGRQRRTAAMRPPRRKTARPRKQPARAAAGHHARARALCGCPVLPHALCELQPRVGGGQSSAVHCTLLLGCRTAPVRTRRGSHRCPTGWRQTLVPIGRGAGSRGSGKEAPESCPRRKRPRFSPKFINSEGSFQVSDSESWLYTMNSHSRTPGRPR